MASGPGPTQKDNDLFGLDERSLEELKEKAVAAKERAYCRCCFSMYLVYLNRWIQIFCLVRKQLQPSSRFQYAALIRYKDPRLPSSSTQEISKSGTLVKRHTLFLFSFFEPLRFCLALYFINASPHRPPHITRSRFYPTHTISNLTNQRSFS